MISTHKRLFPVISKLLKCKIRKYLFGTITIRTQNSKILDYCTIPPPRRMTSIVWLDLEMTGLDYKRDRIMEIACLITDNSLNIIAEGPHLIINQPQSLLDSMGEWCTATHTKVNICLLIYFLFIS